MRFSGLMFLALASMATDPASAAQIFSCGGADVRIDVRTRESPVFEDRVEGVVTVSRDGADTILRYRHIDFIGGHCAKDRNAQALVIFQAYCGGSVCKDRANWGVIDPRTLRVLTVPSDANREETQKIVGNNELPHLQMMSVSSEARKQGVRAP